MKNKTLLIAGGVLVAGLAVWLVVKNKQSAPVVETVPEKLPPLINIPDPATITKSSAANLTADQKKVIAATTGSGVTASGIVFGQKVAGLGAAYAFS